MSNSEIILAILLTFLLAILASQYAKADILPEWDTDDIIAELGYSAVMGSENNTEVETQKRIMLGYNGIYGFATQEDMEIRMMGQLPAWGEATTYGLGYQHEILDSGVTLFIEYGKGDLDLDISPTTQSELSLSYLERHKIEGRDRPYEVCGTEPKYADGCSRGSDLDYDDTYVGRIGMKFRPVPHVSISAGYRWMQSKAYISSYDKERKANNGGWWEEHYTENLGAFEVGVFATW